MIGGAGQHLAQIGFGIKTVEFRRTDQAIDRSGAFPARIRSGKQVVLPAQGDATQRAFGGVVVDLDVAILLYSASMRPSAKARNESPPSSPTCARVSTRSPRTTVAESQ